MNIAQLNLSSHDTKGLEKIKLISDGLMETVDFQAVLQSLLGIQMNDFPGNVLPDQGEALQPDPELKLDLEVFGGIMNPQLAGPEANESLINLDNPLSTTSAAAPPELTESMVQSAGENEMPVSQQDLSHWVQEGLKEEIEVFIKRFQSEMQILQVEENTSSETVTHTPQSYNNLQRIKLNATAQEKSIDGWIEKKVEVQEKFQLKETEIGKPRELAKATLHPEEPLKAEKGKGLQIEESNKVEIPIKSENAPIQAEKLNTQSMEKMQSIKHVSNDQQLREAMIESIRDTHMVGVSKVKVQLHPKELGHVEIELKLSDGKIEGEIKVMNAEMKSQIEQIITPVKEMMKSEQFSMKDFNVTVMDQGNSPMSGGQQHQEQSSSNYFSEEEFYMVDEEIQEKAFETSSINFLA